MLSEMTTKHASNSPVTHKNTTILLCKLTTRLRAVSRDFFLVRQLYARKRETARSLACNWRQAQFSALKGYMYIMGEKQTGHFLLQKLSFIISISVASHLVPLWNRGLWQLGNGPLVFMCYFPDFSIIHIQILQTDLYIFP